MKKALLSLAGAALGVVVLVSAILCLMYLTSSNKVTFDVGNESKAVLHNVTLIASGLPDSRMEEMLPGQSFVVGMRLRNKVTFRVQFDSDGNHYDLPAEVRLFPFGLWTVWVRVGDRMQISIKTVGGWGS